jgi:predicted ester cyclase
VIFVRVVIFVGVMPERWYTGHWGNMVCSSALQAQEQPQRTHSMTQMLASTPTELNRQIAERFIAALDRHDFATSDAMMAPEFKLCFSGLELNREQSIAMIRDVYQAFNDFKHHIEESFAVDDVVIMRITDRATHTGVFEGIAPTGRTITIGQISILRVKDDQITEIREEADMLGLMQQLGAIPAPGAA